MPQSAYDPQALELFWQKRWQEDSCFSPAPPQSGQPKFYLLEMFPYPSGRIHMGHVRLYAMGDVLARYKRAKGFNVLHPMGWDAFGLPAENAARQQGAHPAEWTRKNIALMRVQLQRLGLSIDWSREFATCDDDYCLAQQKLFLEFWRLGLVRRREAEVNWDPVEQSVLANEQVIDGRGWRSGAKIEKKRLEQWFLAISESAPDLLAGLEQLPHWPDKVKLMQKNWIGRQEGAKVRFKVEGARAAEADIEVFTTRADTLFGAAFLALAADHPLARKIAAEDESAASFAQQCRLEAEAEARGEKPEKKGYLLPFKVRSPFEERLLPVYIANFVLMGYGTGAVFGCPAHDQRDLEFARAHDLPVRRVVKSEEEGTAPIGAQADGGEGVMIDSGFLTGLASKEARNKAAEKLERLGAGGAAVTWRLRDWGISRQRYWGCPIPVIHCQQCGAQPVAEENLPVLLPEDVDFAKAGNPLERAQAWKKSQCPECGGEAVRETDTFDTFVDSSWYFLRFAAPKGLSPQEEKDACAYWLPVDHYLGGIEHAILHLLYARYFTRALQKAEKITFSEPFARLFTQGMVNHQTFQNEAGDWLSPEEVMEQHGKWVERGKPERAVLAGAAEKMSKSRCNSVPPDPFVERYGADAIRWFMLSDSPPERDIIWNERGVSAAKRFLSRAHDLALRLAEKLTGAPKPTTDTPIRREAHRVLATFTGDLEAMHFNSAIARLYAFLPKLAESEKKLDPNNHEETAACREALGFFLIMLNPFAPHLAETCWQALGEKTILAQTIWPEADPALLEEKTPKALPVSVNGRKRAELLPPAGGEEALRAALLALPAIERALEGKKVKKIIFVPDRIINIVV